MELLRKFGIDLIIDIGANTGQYAQKMRQLGYTGRIVSFEPLPDAFEELSKKASKDPLWEAVNLAAGNEEGEIELHVSQNSYSSSILDMLPAHAKSAPDSVYTNISKASIRLTNSLINTWYREGQHLLLKIDTQGYERQVYEGCRQSLDKITGFQMELSLLPLYRGETLMQEMADLLRNDGYRLMLLDPGHQDYQTGEILQLDGLFFK